MAIWVHPASIVLFSSMKWDICWKNPSKGYFSTFKHCTICDTFNDTTLVDVFQKDKALYCNVCGFPAQHGFHLCSDHLYEKKVQACLAVVRFQWLQAEQEELEQFPLALPDVVPTPEVEYDPVQHTREDLVDHLTLEVNFDGVYEQVQVHLAHLQPGPQFFRHRNPSHVQMHNPAPHAVKHGDTPS
jgi:hypothetical protein